MIRFALIANVVLACSLTAFASPSPEPYLESGKHLLFGEDFAAAKVAFHEAALRSGAHQAATAQLLSQIAADCDASQSNPQAADWTAFGDTIEHLDMNSVDPWLHDWLRDRKAEVHAQQVTQRVTRAILQQLGCVYTP